MRKVWILFVPLALIGRVDAQLRSDGEGVAPFLAGIADVASLQRSAESHLSRAQEWADRLIAVRGTRTIENTLRPYDEVRRELEGGRVAGVFARLHSDAGMRRAADEIVGRFAAFRSQFELNRGVYDALAALDTSRADSETKYYVERELQRFHLNGVDKDETTRARIATIRQQLVAVQREFDRNFRSDVRQIMVTDVSELAGLPADYVAQHRPDASGAVTLTTNAPDAGPVMTYAKSDDLRRRMFVAMNNVGYPVNTEVLRRMITTRAELATLLGFDSWADVDAAPRMVGTAKNASDFIDRIFAASEREAAREYDALLKRKQRDSPGATVINAWDQRYYGELLRRETYDVDSQVLRAYLTYDRVRDGIFDVTGRLFGLTFHAVKDVPVWDPSVEVYEVAEDGRVVGRIYLDTHPRPNKGGNVGGTLLVRAGIAGVQIPEGIIALMLPGGRAGDPGLLLPNDVRSFFHEFGHLVHGILAGQHHWIGVADIPFEFAEAPSQLLEEWSTDPRTLTTFARHFQTNEPIPAALVDRLRRQENIGKALAVRNDMIAAKFALSIHDRDPRAVDFTATLKELNARYLPGRPFVEGTHRETSFEHLANPGYASAYYTYLWLGVVVKDLFTQFDRENLLAPDVAHRYRDAVLVPGGSKPEAMLIQDFLGRQFSMKAWEEWLNAETQ